MGRILDGFSEHLEDYPAHQTFVRADVPEADHDEVVAALRASRAEVMLNYLPVGSEEATRFYMECALEAGVALVNCMPVFIASDPLGRSAFANAACRSSATTSRRNWARRSCIGC